MVVFVWEGKEGECKGDGEADERADCRDCQETEEAMHFALA